MQWALVLMLFSPLVGSLVNGFLLRGHSARVVGLVATVASGLAFVGALALSGHWLATGLPVRLSIPWMGVGTLDVSWGFAFDSLTLLMSLVVTGIGTLIHAYSMGYMSEDETPYRYFAYLNLFLFSMLVLITASNLAVLFVGWEGVGLCSYLLIGYWHGDIAKADAGRKAFVMNRIGDAAFLVGMFLCYYAYQTLDFATMGQMTLTSTQLHPRVLELAAFFLFLGATGKSAQIPLFTWLPDAMAGPTPVSALIHAATMVTAGIYLVARLGFLYQVSPDVGGTIAIIGAATALLAASVACAQRDIKKVLAYSTVSQLGFMFVALGVGAYTAALFHVMTHAFFKALLFLGAGSVIHGLHGEQDICKMGGLRHEMPWTFLVFTVGVAAIAGLPPLSGFFSKDAIVFAALASERGSIALWAVLSLCAGLTAFYMGRLYLLVFLGDRRGGEPAHESPAVMLVPMLVLAAGSVFAGFLGLPHGLHLAPHYLDALLVPTVPGWTESHAFLGELPAMGVAVVVSLVGLAASWFLYHPGPERSERVASRIRPLQAALFNKWWIDELYAFLFVQPFRALCDFLARVFDPRVVDAAVTFPARAARAGSALVAIFQTGATQFYLWILVVGGLVVFWLSVKGWVL